MQNNKRGHWKNLLGSQLRFAVLPLKFPDPIFVFRHPVSQSRALRELLTRCCHSSDRYLQRCQGRAFSHDQYFVSYSFRCRKKCNVLNFFQPTGITCRNGVFEPMETVSSFPSSSVSSKHIECRIAAFCKTVDPAANVSVRIAQTISSSEESQPYESFHASRTYAPSFCSKANTW